VSTEEELARQRLRELKDWAEGKGPRCTQCQRLLLPGVYEAGGVCLVCQWPEGKESSRDREGKRAPGVTALQVPAGEASITVETQESSGEESSLKRKRRLTRERVQRYRERKQGG
jgi:hypothetical protein